MKQSGATRGEAGYGAGERHSPSLAVIATGLLMSVAASLAGCGEGDGCTPAGEPIPGNMQTITYTPDAIRDVYIRGNTAWETEIITVADATNEVSIEINEKLAEFFEVEQDDTGRLVLQMSQDKCKTTDAKVRITVPAPVRTLEVGIGSATADKVTRTVNYLPQGIITSLSGVHVNELDGDDVEIRLEPVATCPVCYDRAIKVDSVHANSLTIIAQSDVAINVDVLDGYVSQHVEVHMDKEVQVQLGEVTTPNAEIWAGDALDGSLFGLNSQNCTINSFGAGPETSFTVVTNVTEYVEAQCASPPAIFIIEGPAVKSGSCFDETLGMQTLV